MGPKTVKGWVEGCMYLRQNNSSVSQSCSTQLRLTRGLCLKIGCMCFQGTWSTSDSQENFLGRDDVGTLAIANLRNCIQATGMQMKLKLAAIEVKNTVQKKTKQNKTEVWEKPHFVHDAMKATLRILSMQHNTSKVLESKGWGQHDWYILSLKAIRKLSSQKYM